MKSATSPRSWSQTEAGIFEHASSQTVLARASVIEPISHAHPSTWREVREALDAIYLTDLRTPAAQGSVVTTWHDASKLVPVHQAELTVQKILKVGLTQRFLGSFQVLEEQPAPSGRLTS